MYVKGSLKERCMVEAQIIGILIREEVVTYTLDIDGCIVYVPEVFIHFNDYENDDFQPVPDSLLEDDYEGPNYNA